MGLMNWFTPSRRSLARAQIEGSLKAWKLHGLFEGDPAARDVLNNSVSRVLRD